MSFTERLKAAMKGSREMRAILIRDPNKMISAAVLSSPQADTEPEVESFARMANVSEDVLRVIGNNRAWMKNYGVVVALTKNPKTPLAMSLNLMARLNDRDVATLSVDRNVPEPLRVGGAAEGGGRDRQRRLALRRQYQEPDLATCPSALRAFLRLLPLPLAFGAQSVRIWASPSMYTVARSRSSSLCIDFSRSSAFSRSS